MPAEPPPAAAASREKEPAFLSSDTLAQLESPEDGGKLARPGAGESALLRPSPEFQLETTLPEAEELADDRDAERSRKFFAGLADGIIVLILAGAGILVGEMVARKGTADILREAGSAPTFPPIDPLIWLGCLVFFPLIYAWLGTRGWTLGAWLRRRAE